MSTVRVTGGLYRGRLIQVPRGDFEIRPAMDRMRESLFSILGPLDGYSFLDLFSGSGIVGIEAASRGADPVECVERDRAKLPVLIKNVSICAQRIECHAVPVERYLERSSRRWDIVFLDPPFPYPHKQSLLEMIARNRVAKAGGKVLIHHPSEDAFADRYGALSLKDEREYGRSRVRFYEFEEDAADSEPSGL